MWAPKPQEYEERAPSQTGHKEIREQKCPLLLERRKEDLQITVSSWMRPLRSKPILKTLTAPTPYVFIRCNCTKRTGQKKNRRRKKKERKGHGFNVRGMAYILYGFGLGKRERSAEMSGAPKGFLHSWQNTSQLTEPVPPPGEQGEGAASQPGGQGLQFWIQRQVPRLMLTQSDQQRESQGST